MTAMTTLIDLGQSYWLDSLSRAMIADGSLRRRVAEEGLRGVTSNPEIFSRAMGKGTDYDEQIAKLVSEHLPVEALYERLAVKDIQDACDILRRVYDESDGADGFVSIEVSPHLAHSTEGSVAEARRLWQAVDRPNVMMKIPGTREGVPAIETLLAEGINVNITLLFAVERYEEVAEAYLRALERRQAEDLPLTSVASVASFFVSRIDVLVDELLNHRAEGGQRDAALALRGKAAVANAKLAYQFFKRLTGSDRWAALSKAGARPQRLLWASTSTKNPDYPDLIYVESLIGRETVNTMPAATIAAFRDHGAAKADTVETDIDAAREVMAGLAKLGIDFAAVTQRLEDEALEKFIVPFDSILRGLTEKAASLGNHEATDSLRDVARNLRRLVIRMTTEAGSGHPTSCMSCADIVAALFFHEMRWDPQQSDARNVDSFILSKGHAAPILWAALCEAGAIDEDPLTLRKIDSSLQGHPMPDNPWVRIATGSLGQGLAAANGIAAANRLDGIDARVFCLLGDGECSEGSVWEAAQFASINGLKNLVAIVDVNALGQSGPAPYRHDVDVYVHRFAAFGWKTIAIDGHDMPGILDALARTRDGGPTAIIARTEKGKGVSFTEGAEGWHGKPFDHERMAEALAELGEAKPKTPVKARHTGNFQQRQRVPVPHIALSYAKGDKVATREAFGHALQLLGNAMPDIVVVDGDVQNSTYTQLFGKDHPERFFEGYIAEQNMAGVALGMAVSGKVPYVATFASFLSRAHDFIRMAAYSRPPHLIFCGSHAGVSIGEDGPSQMGLEDIAMFRAMLGSTVLSPADAVCAARLTEEAARADGIVYIRTARPKNPVIYDNDEAFPIGGSKVLRSSDDDAMTIVATGVALHEALAAQEALAGSNIRLRVIDAYSVKPLDVETLTRAATETKGLIVVEDHYAEGGLGEAVAAAINPLAPVYRLAVRRMPCSATAEQLFEREGISRDAIVKTARKLAA